jgi:rubrerythrin
MNNNTDKKLVPAYQTMMARVDEDAKKPASHNSLQEHIDAAIETAIKLNELSHVEAERIGYYLRRDLQDAAAFIVDTEKALVDWINFDIELIENRLLEMFSIMVDQTQLELNNLEERARQATQWNSGEITALGVLYCDNCNHALHFQKPDFIPACPNCGATSFHR